MKNYPNIETHKINGHYVGYSPDGRSWRIVGRHGNWSAYANVTKQGSEKMFLCCDTLAYVSNMLAGVSK